MKVLIFGATGAAGGSVLRTCLAAPMVREVRAVTRRPLARTHPKLREIVHDNYLEYSGIADAFAGIDLCLFCLGVSATQVSEEDYRRITHDMTLAAAEALHAASPDALFEFITGRGTDAEGRFMWARVKGATEQELIRRFGAVCLRPAAIGGEPSASAPWYYRLIRPCWGYSHRSEASTFRGPISAGECFRSAWSGSADV
ncbi:MAG: epimerase [Bacteroidetes bacterium]|nr:epimerase [Bacteroidota bacterium]